MIIKSFGTTSSITDNKITISNHDLETGVPVKYDSGTDPTPYNIGLVDETTYYVVKIDNNNLYLTQNLSDIKYFMGQFSDLIDIDVDSIYIPEHNLVTGDRVVYSSGDGVDIGGLVSYTIYWVIRLDENRIKLASTLSNANNNIEINLTTIGENFSHFVSKYLSLNNGGTPEQTHYLVFDQTNLIGEGGSTGFIGATGQFGSTGLRGTTGFIGSTGFIGATGNFGSTGFTGATGPIGGSNTQVLYNSSGTTAGSSNLTFDGIRLTSNALTVGSSSSLSNLHINGSSSSPSSELGNLLITTGSTSKRMAFGVDSSATMYSWIQSVENGVVVRKLCLNPIGGNIGINNIDPTYALDVNGVIRGTNDLYLTKGTSPFIGTTDTQDLRFGTSFTERMRIGTNGNVGISTSNPQTLLTIGSYVAGTGEATTRGYIQIQDPTESANLDGNRGLEFKNSPSGFGYGWKMGGVGGINFAIGNRDNSATFTERFRIDSSGNVLINTTTSGSKLQVVGAASLGVGANSSALSGYQLTVTGAYGKAIASDNTSLSLMTLDSLVNQPLSMALSVIGNATATSRYGYIQVGEYSTGNWRNLVLQPSGGNVGINTTEPSETLGVNGIFGIGNQLSTGTSGALRIICTGGVNYIQSGQNKTLNSSAPLVFTNMLAGSEWMRIDSVGNVGIGMTNPSNKLHIAGIVQIDQVSGFADLYMGSGTTGNSGKVSYDNNNSRFLLSIGGSEKIRIESVGNIKVGGTADRTTTVGTNQIILFNGTAPVGTLTNGCSFYSTSGEMRVMDAAGNATLLSPHDSASNEWIFDSIHSPSGKRLKIDVERLLRFINDYFGLDFVHEFIEK